MEARLRPWRVDDAPALTEAWARSGDLGPQTGDADLSDPLAARSFIEQHMLQEPGAGGAPSRNWAVDVDGQAVGNIGLSAIELRHGTAWAYYWLSRSVRGRGLAARGLASVAAWAFEQDLFRLELGHRTNNPASCSVALRAGFLAEGIERQKLRYGQERYDVELHARLATDPAPSTSLLPLQRPSSGDRESVTT
ncbi:GNAT family protein [Zhihengliuella sp.]|uniref:GNAT family N-acetyltransferase n=1 Tax=Zhihengliuella sp. TaxID=1954483 RepID=UPI00281120A2|nr:GNAT family protein [Zhihengliuella sp.]